MSQSGQLFNINCTACPRLSKHLKLTRKKFPDYYCRPVPAFGVPDAQLLIVGLAPGMHGANATGRPFTGDYAGIMLYEMLHKFGFANKSVSTYCKDGLKLKHCRITNAVKCLPPENKPTASEVNTCNHYLAEELKQLNDDSVMLCLGQIAHKAVIKALGLRQADYPFGHANRHQLENGQTIIDSYHCSRYNTQTRRLTESMFEDVFLQVKEILTI